MLVIQYKKFVFLQSFDGINKQEHVKTTTTRKVGVDKVALTEAPFFKKNWSSYVTCPRLTIFQ